MKDVGILVFPGFQVLDLAAIAAFELTNIHLRRTSTKDYYRVQVLSEDGGPVTSSCGVAVQSERLEAVGFDTLVLAGATTIAPSSARLRCFLRTSMRHTRRITSVCTGAFILAEAGLLEGRRATTHWAFAQDLQSRYPGINVEPDHIYINDGPFWTSAGMTAGIDLMLALVEGDLGIETARVVAKQLVVYRRRTGAQTQVSTLLDLEPKSSRIEKALTYAGANLHEDLSVRNLAEVAHLSPRQFSRAFKAETGHSPARAIANLRVEAARALINADGYALSVVARMTGFGDT